MSPKAAVKWALQRAGVTAISRNHLASRYLEEAPQTGFDYLLLRVFPNLERLRFLQIGANNGIRVDPIRRHVLRHHWEGLLIEPQPKLFGELRANYSSCAGLGFLNAAVDVRAGKRPMHFLRPDLTGLPDWAWGLGSFSRERVQTAAAELGLTEGDIATEEVITATWDQIIAQFGEEPCDVLVIDTEGYDIPLIRAAPLDRWKPKLLHFEHACASMPERMDVMKYLLDLGYEIASDGPDTSAWRSTVVAP